MLVIVLGTLVIFTFDPCLDPMPADLLPSICTDESKDRPMQTTQYDVVIVGAGGAGMRAAIESGQRARTAVLTKLYPTRSHTGAAQGGMCAALANVEEDNWEWHTFDTVKGGDYLVDQDAAEVMCKEAIDAVLDLEKMGLPFNRTPEGRIDQRRFGGHTRNHGEAAVRRSCYAADRTGHMILQTLYQNCVKQDVEFFNEFYVLDLLLTDDADGAGRTAGVVAYELATGEIHVFQAKSVVFATGGAGKVFKTTSNAHTLTGDGMGIAFRRACRWRTWSSSSSTRPAWPAWASCSPRRARGEGGILRNADGERFMERYAPTIKDLAPRDIVARVDGQRGPRGPRLRPEQGLRAARPDPPASRRTSTPSCPDITEFARTYLGVEPYTEPVPVYPTAHYAMGGIPTNIEAEVLRDNDRRHPGPVRRRRGRLRVGARLQPPGHQLAARHQRLRPARRHRRRRVRAGPPTSSSCRRTRRPSSSTMLEAHARRRPAASGSPTIRKELQETMDLNAQVFRTEESLKQALADIEALQGALRATSSVQDKGKRFNTDLLEAVELGFLLDLAEVMVVGALAPQGIPRRPLPRGLPAPRRRELHAAHDGLPRASASDGIAASASTTSRSCRPATSRWSASTDDRDRRRTPADPGGGGDPASTSPCGSAATTPRSTTSRTGRATRSRRTPPTACSTRCTRSSGSMDGSLTFRRSCAHGVCGSDAMRINGRNRLACKTLLKDLNPSKPITVEPIKGLPVMKDLVVDMEPFFEAYRESCRS